MKIHVLLAVMLTLVSICMMLTTPTYVKAADDSSSGSGSGSGDGGGGGNDNNDGEKDGGGDKPSEPQKDETPSQDETPTPTESPDPVKCDALECNQPDPTPTPTPTPKPDPCHDNDNFTSCDGNSGGSGHSGSNHLAFAKKSGKSLVQIPSIATDFPDNDPSPIQVHATSAKKDVIGSYEINGEITNVGNDTLQFVHVTAHVFDDAGQLIGSGDGYTNPTDLDPQHTGTYNMFVSQDSLSGKPTSYRLSYDWS